MTEKLEIHGHEVEFLKNDSHAVIEIDLGDATDECYLIDVFSVDGVDYVALVSSESKDIYLFYYEESFNDDQLDLEVIQDEEELETVFHLFTHYWDDKAIDDLVDEYIEEFDINDDDEFIDEDDEFIDDEDFGIDE